MKEESQSDEEESQKNGTSGKDYIGVGVMTTTVYLKCRVFIGELGNLVMVSRLKVPQGDVHRVPQQ